MSEIHPCHIPIDTGLCFVQTFFDIVAVFDEIFHLFNVFLIENGMLIAEEISCFGKIFELLGILAIKAFQVVSFDHKPSYFVSK